MGHEHLSHLRFDIPAEPIAGRRGLALALSVPLHLALGALAAALPAVPSGPPNEPRQSEITITYADAADRSPAFADLPLPDPPDVASGGEFVGVAGFHFDIAKIRARKEALFPFLTGNLQFLARLQEDIQARPSKLTNPFHQPNPREPRARPLSLSDADLQQTIDAAWSRRERWRTFSGIAALVRTHDPDTGRLPEVLRGYLDQNILQPFCDGRARDPRFWAMLENASEHADFVDFTSEFARTHPSSRVTTELLFLLDELAQGSRDALFMLLSTEMQQDLAGTAASNREAFDLAVALQRHYREWLDERRLESPDVARHYDEARLALLSTIVESSPDGYRTGDARFLMGEIFFNRGSLAEAVRSWLAITIDARDSYAAEYSRLLEELRSPAGVRVKQVRSVLESVYGRWRAATIERLHQFGHRCDTF